jgi:hypothetical protein
MSINNYTSQLITKQISQKSGQIAVTQSQGGWQYVDTLTGNNLTASASSNLLANPQQPNDPKIKGQSIELAKGYFANKNVPDALIDAIATVAAYVSATQGIPVNNLISNTSISLQLIQAYNSFKPKTSQVGIIQGNLAPTWTNNPTLRGSIAAAITDQV